jgi:serine protease
LKPHLGKLSTLVLAVVLTALSVASAAAAESAPRRLAPSAPTEDPAGARVIVRYKAMSSIMKAQPASAPTRSGPQHAAVMAQRTGLIMHDGRMLDGRTQVLHGDKSLTSMALAARLAADSDVEFAVPDLRRHILALPNDPLFAASASVSPASGQWYLQAPDSTLVAAINAPGAWNITTGSSSVVVADIDTGVRPDHPDLANKLLPGYNFASTDGNGTGWSAGGSDPGDYTTTTNQCGDGLPPQPSSWHGTQVMGLIGAQTNNGIGMASIGHDVMLLPVRALAACGGYDSDIIAGMLWAAGMALPSNDPAVPANPHPARVINLSLGSSGSCSGTVYARYIPQIIAAGVTVVAAAGNDGLAVGIPANCPGVIAVAGVRHVGTKVGYSDLGPQIALSAPAGNCVDVTGASCLYPLLTTTNPGSTTPIPSASLPSGQLYTDGANNYSVGTSFSSPLVAGTAALMLSTTPSLTPMQIKSMLQSTARSFPTTSADATPPLPTACVAPTSTPQNSECICTTSTCGAGLLDAAAAVSAASALAAPVAAISTATSTVTAGTNVNFDGSNSTAPSGYSIASYQWTIASGNSVATITSATNASTATVATSAAGSFTISLTVTDSAGNSGSGSRTVTVTAAAAPGAPPATASSGSGGGAMSWAWLAALALAAALLALWRPARMPRSTPKVAANATDNPSPCSHEPTCAMALSLPWCWRSLRAMPWPNRAACHAAARAAHRPPRCTD